jgi:hypothetical protein
MAIMQLQGYVRACVRWIAVAAGILAGASGAAADDLPTFLGLTFPQEIGGAVIGQPTDYEKNLLGFGYSLAYRRPGWKTDVYIYNLRTVVPADPLSAAVKHEFNRAKREIFELQKRGFYSNVVAKNDYMLVDRSGHTRFVCAAFGFFHSQIQSKVDSFLCLTPWNGQFVKFRMTTPQRQDSRADARRFIEAWFKILWPSEMKALSDQRNTARSL